MEETGNRMLRRTSIMISEILLIGQISEQAPGTLLWRTGQTESKSERERRKEGETFTDTRGVP